LINDNEQELIRVAVRYSQNAHAPYSNFKVGAAVQMEDGAVYGGCNIENISYPATICAEKVAIAKAVSEKSQKIKCLVVYTNANDPWPPCGNCLQFALPYSTVDTKVVLANHKGDIRVFKISDLAPVFYDFLEKIKR